MKASIRRTVFAIAAVSSLSAKIIHIYAHSNATSASFLVFWGASFFFQDIILLLGIRALLELGSVFSSFATAITGVILLLTSTNIAFFLLTGFEPQWRNIGLAVNPSAWSTLLVGLAPTFAISAVLVLVSVVSRNVWTVLAEASTEVILLGFSRLVVLLRGGLPRFDQRVLSVRRHWNRDTEEEEGLTKHDAGSESELHSYNSNGLRLPSRLSRLHVFCGSGLAWQLLSTVVRPSRVYARYMSWTTLLIPLVAFTSSPSHSSIPLQLDGHTTAQQAEGLLSLPSNLTASFGEAHGDSFSYIAAEDPLKQANMDEDMLPTLGAADMHALNIRHVVLLTLESTRHDVFPLQKDGVIWQRLAATFDGQEILQVVQERLDSLTPFASWLVAGVDDSPERSSMSANWTARGSIVAEDAVTTSTYTLKSLTGTHCGISPVAADFNLEYTSRIYQPCLPQLFDMFNNLRCPADEKSADAARSGEWTSVYMQSTTLGFDNQDALMLKLGFPSDQIYGSEYLHEQHKFDPVTLPDTNYYGMPEEAVEHYLRDTFTEAKRSNERVFLSHLTSTTHHGFDIPDQSEYVPLSGSWEWESLSRYLNAVGYVDRWLGKIMDILESESVANETLVVVVGDHGLSIAEQGSYTPYQNPHVASSRVPLVLSLPGLPNVKISEPVSTLQVLPTVLDLLIETESLPKCAIEAAHELVRNYEGQSLLRPLKSANATSERGNWQFVVTNPGGSVVAVRDARYPHWRLVVPLLPDQEWWFSDLGSDLYEMAPIRSLDAEDLLERVEASVGGAGVTWAKEATKVTRWWVSENHKRWQYDSS
ncbi:hypothetical protein Q7P35_007661 [Cladosporium inversicolor]